MYKSAVENENDDQRKEPNSYILRWRTVLRTGRNEEPEEGREEKKRAHKGPSPLRVTTGHLEYKYVRDCPTRVFFFTALPNPRDHPPFRSVTIEKTPGVKLTWWTLWRS
ncbi:hypothetical protein GWI33_012525 [Rhynchophorus ferrugineus]|uniref:Uncharacterized protein n=1 Tax=Rhynchophorus ferrugineus TaxID=354439 RepID=A0A834I8R5_RHYFE|nr:hypothetical protein GWI33_012525 [Rhynchophorus ferrugineus]